MPDGTFGCFCGEVCQSHISSEHLRPAACELHNSPTTGHISRLITNMLSKTIVYKFFHLCTSLHNTTGVTYGLCVQRQRQRPQWNCGSDYISVTSGSEQFPPHGPAESRSPGDSDVRPSCPILPHPVPSCRQQHLLHTALSRPVSAVCV
uniref:Uncharacterized protein n=1 Tax=Knipowitschia caucasica TaxID=637954 RepID=A0AAV2JEG1_KNICA